MILIDAPFIDNREPRCACVLVVDTSGSMHGAPIDALNHALVSSPFRTANTLSNKRCEIALVTFGPVKTVCPFVAPHDFDPPPLVADGLTPLGAAVRHALALIDERLAHYNRLELHKYPPWIMLITDGGPDADDDWESAARACREREAKRDLVMWAIAVPGAGVRMDVLKAFSGRRAPATLADNKFQELLEWVAKSLNAYSLSGRHDGRGGDPSDPVDFEPPSTWMKP